MIKAIFFDIDGTLVPHGKTQMPKSTLKALCALKEKGIKLFIATGRPPASINHVKAMFSFDGFLTANGQYCFNENTIIHEQYIPKESIQQVIPYIEDNHIPVVFATIDNCYRNQYNNFEFDKDSPVIDLKSLMNDNIVQIMTYLSPNEDKLFLKHTPQCQSARWTDAFADIIPEDGGKDRGIDHMIQYYNISLDEVMAFGDGENDLTMLKHVPYSVAMGNANDVVKSHANYTTTHIEDNGIANALIHFGILDKSILE